MRYSLWPINVPYSGDVKAHWLYQICISVKQRTLDVMVFPYRIQFYKRTCYGLGQLITYFKPTQLLIVGDLFHAESNTDLNTFENWINQFNTLRMVLIKGNHDRISTAVAERFKLSIMSPSLFIPPLNFVHDYEETLFNHFCISGHTHPGVLMEGKGRQRIKLPCYQLTDNQLILPAFSLFTGLNTRQAPKDCQVFAFTDTAIFKV